MKNKSLHLIIAGLIVTNIFTLSKLNTMEDNIYNRIQNLEHSQNNIRNQMDDIYSNVDSMLKKEASILDSYRIELGDLNPSDFTIPVNLTIIPKEYTDDLTASLMLNDEDYNMEKNGRSFSAIADVNVLDDLQIKINLHQDEITHIETIEQYYDLKSQYLLDIYGVFSGSSSYGSTTFSYIGDIELDFYNQEGNNPVEITIIDEVNGEIVDELVIDEAIVNNRISIAMDKRITLEAKDKFNMYANVKDKYGLIYKYLILAYAAPLEGEETGFDDPYRYEIVKISDESGNVLWEEDMD